MPDVEEQQKPQEQKPEDSEQESKRAAVKQWLSRISAAKKRWENDFKRMRNNIDFCFGLQRDDQEKLDDEEYTTNLTLRNVNHKVATLYAKNPKAEWQRRQRMDFQIWDGKMESVLPIYQRVTMAAAMGVPPPLSMQDMALIQDYLRGMQFREQVERVGKTLEIAYQYQIDEHDPDFKLQMKQLVRRVSTCGVGYVLLAFCRDVEKTIASYGMDAGPMDRLRRLQYNIEKLKDENLDSSNPRIEQVKSLLASMMLTMSGDSDEQYLTSERLVFDFLPAMSVIPDENCSCLKGFIGARYLAIETIMPLEDVNVFFELSGENAIKTGGELKVYKGEGQVEQQAQTTQEKDDKQSKPKVSLLRVLDKTTKSHFYLVDGYKDYVQEPQPLEPSIRGFWPLFALTFNDTESIPSSRSSIFPPSDVDLMFHAQKEWNRSRDELRKHRNANAAKYLTQKGMLTEEDKDKLEFAESNAIIELQLNDPKADVSKVLIPMTHQPIDPALYDTGPQEKDILLAVGNQEANIGPPNPKGTATGQAIAEQSRTVGVASNVDDLDDFLGLLADAGGQLLLQEMSQETVQKIVGIGASWPIEQKEDFLNEIYLKHVASSSGRPNKVLELQNWQLILPYLIQAGANPQFIVRETIKRVDDRIDPAEAFPLLPPPMSPQGGPGGPAGPRPQALPESQTAQQPRPQGRPGPGRTGHQAPR